MRRVVLPKIALNSVSLSLLIWYIYIYTYIIISLIYDIYIYIKFKKWNYWLLVLDHHIVQLARRVVRQVIEPIEGPGSQMCSTKGSGATDTGLGNGCCHGLVVSSDTELGRVTNQVWSMWVGPSMLQRILARWKTVGKMGGGDRVTIMSGVGGLERDDIHLGGF